MRACSFLCASYVLPMSMPTINVRAWFGQAIGLLSEFRTCDLRRRTAAKLEPTLVNLTFLQAACIKTHANSPGYPPHLVTPSNFTMARHENVCIYPRPSTPASYALLRPSGLVQSFQHAQCENACRHIHARTYTRVDALMRPSGVVRPLSLYISTDKTQARLQLPPTPGSVWMR